MDDLTFKLSTVVDGAMSSPFASKTWCSILDENSSNYASGQVTISTGALSNNSKYLNYSEAYLQVPLLITVSTDAVGNFAPATPASDASYCIGMKNWYGSIIHSMSVSMNGSVVIQQQPLQSILNSFKLATTMSWNDVEKM